jgi:CRISPR/Cas system CSM-associated protein Csm2 small subunit
MAKHSSSSRWIPIVVGLVAVALWLAWAWYVNVRFPAGSELPPDVQQVAAVRGQFGDMFGGINALFTALILAGAVYTVWLQHRELEALGRQQEESNRNSDRAAALLAHTVLVNAKSSLLNTRYQMTKDLSQRLQGEDPNSELSAQFKLMIITNSHVTGNLMTDLESLAKELSSMLREIREQKEGVSPKTGPAADA